MTCTVALGQPHAHLARSPRQTRHQNTEVLPSIPNLDGACGRVRGIRLADAASEVSVGLCSRILEVKPASPRVACTFMAKHSLNSSGKFMGSALLYMHSRFTVPKLHWWSCFATIRFSRLMCGGPTLMKSLTFNIWWREYR